MVRAKLPNGRIERGNANQRHFARAACELSGVNVVCSYSSETVVLSLKDEASVPEVVRLAREWGGELRFDNDLPIYSNGAASVKVDF